MLQFEKKIINLPPEVKVSQKGAFIIFSGPKGKENLKLPFCCKVKKNSNKLYFKTVGNSNLDNTIRSIIHNITQGVSRGFGIEIKLIGTGYRCELQNNNLHFKLGFNHNVIMKIPQGIKINILKPSHFLVEGSNPEKLGQFVSTIQTFRSPEPYKGKGIVRVGETIRRKQVTKS